jgi:predicted regulator of Ras-like GTPase activity (Roadblock/LC7/MglB family)
MMEQLGSALERLSRVSGVRGALVVDPQVGVPVASTLADETDGGALAALASAMFARMGRVARTAQFGALHGVQLEAEGGRVLVSSAGELLVVVVVEAGAPIGMVRLEVQRAAEGLK